jgi:hypothetical protein
MAFIKFWGDFIALSLALYLLATSSFFSLLLTKRAQSVNLIVRWHIVGRLGQSGLVFLLELFHLLH